MSPSPEPENSNGPEETGLNLNVVSRLAVWGSKIPATADIDLKNEKIYDVSLASIGKLFTGSSGGAGAYKGEFLYNDLRALKGAAYAHVSIGAGHKLNIDFTTVKEGKAIGSFKGTYYVKDPYSPYSWDARGEWKDY